MWFEVDPAPFSYLTQYFYDGPNPGGSCFDSSGFKPTRTVDARGYTTEITYDTLYRPTSHKVQYGQAPDPVAYATTFTDFDEVGNAVREADALGNVTRKDYRTRRVLKRGCATRCPSRSHGRCSYKPRSASGRRTRTPACDVGVLAHVPAAGSGWRRERAHGGGGKLRRQRCFVCRWRCIRGGWGGELWLSHATPLRCSLAFHGAPRPTPGKAARTIPSPLRHAEGAKAEQGWRANDPGTTQRWNRNETAAERERRKKDSGTERE